MVDPSSVNSIRRRTLKKTRGGVDLADILALDEKPRMRDVGSGNDVLIKDMVLIEPDNDSGGPTSRYSGKLQLIGEIVVGMNSGHWEPHEAAAAARSNRR
jgi:hypothetical protein